MVVSCSLQARRRVGITATSSLVITAAEADIYVAIVSGEHGQLTVKLGPRWAEYDNDMGLCLLVKDALAACMSMVAMLCYTMLRMPNMRSMVSVHYEQLLPKCVLLGLT